MRRAGERLDTGWTYRHAPPPPRGARSPARARGRGRRYTRGDVVARAVFFISAWLLFCAGASAAVDAYAVLRAQDVGLHQAQADLKDSLSAAQAGLGADSSSLGRAQILAAQAQAEALSARRRLDSDWLVQHLQGITTVQHQVAATRRLDDLVAQAARLAVRGEALLAGLQDARHAPGHASSIDVAGKFFIAHEKELDALATDALAMPPEVSGVDRKDLVGPLQTAYARLDRPMAQLTAAAPDIRLGLKAAPALLGRDRPVKYLLLFADNAELRPGGGFIGTYATVGFDRGVYGKPHVASVYTLEDPLNLKQSYDVGGIHYVATPRPLAVAFPELTPHALFMRDSAFSVNWPDDARLEQQLYNSESGDQVDGVIQLDVTTISYLLQVTGPIDAQPVGKPPITVNSGNVVEILLTNSRGTNNKEFLNVFEQALNDRLETLAPTSFPAVVRALSRASAERHVMVYMNDASVSPLITAHELDRPVTGPPGDALLPVYANLAGDKADAYTDRSTAITVDAAGHHHLVATFTNRTPGYYAPNDSPFRELVKFYVPPGASAASAHFVRGNLLPRFTAGLIDFGPEFGWHVYGGWIEVERGQTATITFDYSMPPPGPSFTLSLLKQPGAGSWPITVSLNAPGYTRADGALIGNGVVTWKLPLAQDTAFTASRG